MDGKIAIDDKKLNSIKLKILTKVIENRRDLKYSRRALDRVVEAIILKELFDED